jgi:DNA-binding NtrC family response regulator
MRTLVHLNCFCYEDKETLKDNLRDWAVIKTHSMAEAKDAMIESNASVCIVSIDENLIVRQRVQLEELIKQFKSVEWVAILPSKLLELSSVCILIRSYFYDYHTLPIDISRLNTSLGHAYGMANLSLSNAYLSKRSENDKFSVSLNMVGESKELTNVASFIKKVAPVDASVLITGESGTGKELVAKSIHAHSSRSSKPFIAINCGAIPEHLIQSELFGHEKGAFTGATKQRIGRLEAANEGTVFLDEIGDFPLRLQVNLLRCLQEGIIERVGGNQSVFLDLRVVAATNIDLEVAVNEGRFRQDLYYRLNVLHVDIPPLRNRARDSNLLASYFLQKFSSDRKRSPKGFTRKAEDIIASYSWPGNIRELMNRVKRAALLCEGIQVSPADLGFDDSCEWQQEIMTLAGAREEADKSIIVRSLECTNHNISAASKLLDISRLSLYRLISKYSLDTK